MFGIATDTCGFTWTIPRIPIQKRTDLESEILAHFLVRREPSTDNFCQFTAIQDSALHSVSEVKLRLVSLVFFKFNPFFLFDCV